MIYKTLRVDANFTTTQAVKFIAETVNVSSLLTGSEGLYVPDEKKWLDDNTPLSDYESLQDVEHIEFKTKGKDDDDEPTDPKPCPCTIL
uniref:Ubiquitin-like domain-containing protein n=1 Tax=Arcella intermedia TaxID=1963864 RepID=A0A6B2LTZ9_9EUKA